MGVTINVTRLQPGGPAVPQTSVSISETQAGVAATMLSISETQAYAAPATVSISQTQAGVAAADAVAATLEWSSASGIVSGSASVTYTVGGMPYTESFSPTGTSGTYQFLVAGAATSISVDTDTGSLTDGNSHVGSSSDFTWDMSLGTGSDAVSAVNEQWTITFGAVPTGGEFDYVGAGSTVNPTIDVTASLASIELMISSAMPSGGSTITVTPSEDGLSWLIDYGPGPLGFAPTVATTTNTVNELSEQWTIVFAAVPMTGSFAYSTYNGSVMLNATDDETTLAASINLLADTVTVSKSVDGLSWVIDYGYRSLGYTFYVDIYQNTLNALNEQHTLVFSQCPTTGSFTLDYTADGGSLITEIAYDSGGTALQTALAGVLGYAPIVTPIDSVTFLIDYGTTNSVGVPVATSQLDPAVAQNEIWSVSYAHPVASGTLSITGPAGTPSPIAANASAATVAGSINESLNEGTSDLTGAIGGTLQNPFYLITFAGSFATTDMSGYTITFDGTSLVAAGGGNDPTLSTLLSAIDLSQVPNTYTIDATSGPATVTGTLDLTNLTAGNVKDTIVIGGVTGTYNPLAAAVFPAVEHVSTVETAYGPTGAEYAGTLDMTLYDLKSAVVFPDPTVVFNEANGGPANWGFPATLGPGTATTSGGALRGGVIYIGL